MKEITTTGIGTLNIGKQCSIGDNVSIIFSRPGTVEIADYVTLGDNVKMIIDGGDVKIGDWTTLHSETLVLSKTGVDIGAHCWFGQNTILDGTGGLHIENGVRVGMYSQLWTHVAAGEQIEGCTLFGESPIHIGADVWLVGSCMIASGVTIGNRTVALAGSNVTKSCGANLVLAGSPAKSKENLSFYRAISLDEKFELLQGWLAEIAPAPTGEAGSMTRQDDVITLHFDGGEQVRFFKHSQAYELAAATKPANTTLCCVENKRYIKTLSNSEKKVLKYLAGNKARFYS